MAFRGEAPAWFTGEVYEGVADRELLSDTEKYEIKYMF